MNRTLRVIIKWPEGSTLPIRISPCSTGAELNRLVQLSLGSAHKLYLIHKGVRVDPEKSLESQGVQMDAEITIVKQTKEEIIDDLQRKVLIQSQIKALFMESLRIHDMQMNMHDTQLVLQQQSIFENPDDYYSSDDELDEQAHIVINAENSTIPANQPLPKFWESHTEEEEVEEIDSFLNQFSTVEEASAFFSKEKWYGWSW